MAAIAQRNTRLSGVDYAPGDVVPDPDVTRSVRILGLVALVPESAAAGVLTGESGVVKAFDPADHTVAEVVVFLDRYPDEVKRVRANEQAGQNRSTLLAVIDEEEPAHDGSTVDEAHAKPAGDGETGDEDQDDGRRPKPDVEPEPEPEPEPADPDAPAPDSPAPDAPAEGSAVPPPRAGPGSGREAWASFASSSGVGYGDDATKAEIIVTLEAAGMLGSREEPEPEPEPA